MSGVVLHFLHLAVAGSAAMPVNRPATELDMHHELSNPCLPGQTRLCISVPVVTSAISEFADVRIVISSAPVLDQAVPVPTATNQSPTQISKANLPPLNPKFQFDPPLTDDDCGIDVRMGLVSTDDTDEY